jgi:RNA polymerase sigma-70 factor (ECF subfamily)
MSRTTQSVQSLALDFIEKKDNATYTLLINRLRPGLYSFIYKYVQDGDVINEILSQTFISAWEKIDQYNKDFNFSTWIYAIAKNEALGQLRVMNKTVSHDKLTAANSKTLLDHTPIMEMETEIYGPVGEEIVKQLYDASIAIINTLSEPYRLVITEREIKQKQLTDIADELGWHISTVKTRLRKARKDVADEVKKYYPTLFESYLEYQS